jgi:outer membrane protein OmpA-like peptidoglycan-associated protein
MKYLSTTLCAAALALTAGAAMAADETTPTSGPYLTVGGIYNWVDKDNVDASGTTVQPKFKGGWGVLGAGGYEWGRGLRTELEVSHRENKGSYLNTSATPLNGKRMDTALMVNVLFDFNNDSKFTPYIGGGMGIDWVKLSNVSTAGSPVYNGDSHRFAWQGIVGAAYALNANLKLIGEFRYLGSQHHQYNGTAGARLDGYDDHTGQILIGLRYSFGAPAKKEEAVAAAPAPAPAPAPVRAPAPPVPQKFLVFFDFDKSNLRSDAQKIVSEAVEYSKTNGKATIAVTGHADTSGSDTYNMALSERRAVAVQKELQKLGISSKEIGVRWKGEAEPLVQTGDGVKEPQNRRVEIVLE